MIRKLATTVIVGALSFSIYIATGGNVSQQYDFLQDAGFSVSNRDAIVPVRLDEDFAADAGISVYQRVRIPVILTVLADGGRDIQFPPMPPQMARKAIEVMDWNDATISASTGPIAALWGNPRPMSSVGVVKPWCRAKFDAGLPCLISDGGSFGDRNVSQCSLRLIPATCQRVSTGVIFAGDDPQDI